MTSNYWRALARVSLTGTAVLSILSCGDHQPTQPAISFSIVILSTNPQTGPVGGTLPPLKVQAKDSKGHVLFGEVVNFVVTGGGGSVFAPTVVTDINTGIAQETWTLGPVAGPQNVEARLIDPGTGNPLTSAVFTATATPLPASVISIAAGNGQTAVAGSTLPVSPSVSITDRFGNGIAGVSVTFNLPPNACPAGGSATLMGPTQTTNASGIATVGSWTLCGGAGQNTIMATASGIGTVTFTATGINAAAAQLIPATASTVFSGAVGAVIPAGTGPAVRVVDANNNGVPNVAVTFSVTGPSCPSCSAYPGTSPSAPAKISGANTITTLTDANGRASAGDWTLSTLAGPNTLQATAVGLAGSPVVFTATGTAGAAALVFKKAGDGQSGNVGTTLAIPPAVQVTDVYGNLASNGVGVSFTVQSGGGSLSGAAAVTVTTDVSGAASAPWTLGSLAGTNTLTATAVSHTVTFTAIATGPASLTIVNYRGDSQTQPAGSMLPIAPAAQVTDLAGHPVSGVQVVFSVTAGGGAITGGTQITDANGIATIGSWTLGPVAGTNELQAMFNTGVSSGFTIFVATGSLAVAWQQSLSGVGDVWSVAASNSGTIFAASGVFGGFPPETPIGVFRSTDNGATWTLPNTFSSSGATAVTISRTNGDVIVGVSGGGGPTGIPGPFGGGGSGLYRSPDNGGSWTYWTVGNAGVFSVATKPGGLVFAASSNGMYTSPDNGTSWTFVGCCYTRSFAITSNGNIFAGDTKFPTGGGPAANGGVFRSSDQGATWTEVGLPNTAIYSLVATTSDHLFAGTASNGIFRSIDGVTWSQVNASITSPVTSLVVNSAGTIFAAVFGGGVLASTDDGATWTQLNTGLANLAVESLSITSDGFVFAGTHGAVFRTVRSTTSP